MNEPEAVVVDASVLAALAFGEARAEEAAALLRDRRLLAPGLLWYEMSEVARVKSLTRPGETQRIVEQFEMACRLPAVSYSPVWTSLPKLALDTGLTAYDAAYLSLSQSLEAPLATFDSRLREAASDLTGRP